MVKFWWGWRWEAGRGREEGGLREGNRWTYIRGHVEEDEDGTEARGEQRLGSRDKMLDANRK